MIGTYRQDFEQALLAAIDGIHAAAIGDTTWSAALERVCDFVGARAADLNMLDSRTLEYRAFHPARADPFVLRYIADYMSDVAHENPRAKRIYLPMSEGQIIADSDIWMPSELRRMPFFADFLQPWGTHDSLNTWVRRTNDGTPWIALALHFSKQDCPPQAEERRPGTAAAAHPACLRHRGKTGAGVANHGGTARGARARARSRPAARRKCATGPCESGGHCPSSQRARHLPDTRWNPARRRQRKPGLAPCGAAPQPCARDGTGHIRCSAIEADRRGTPRSCTAGTDRSAPAKRTALQFRRDSRASRQCAGGRYTQ